MLACISRLAPTLLGSMDPGSWAASIEAGSRFGFELVWVLLLAKLVALLLHSLSARLGLASGKHLAQACHDEYPTGVCLLLWFFWELSLLFLDSAMVLSCAVGLNMVFGLSVFVGVFIVAVNVVFHASFLPFVAPGKSEAILGAVLLPMAILFVFNALLTGPSLRPLLGGLRPGFKSESLYAVAGLLGANLVPHRLLFRSHFIKKHDTAVLHTILSGALPVVINLAVLMVAAAAFHNTGFAVLTLQDGSVAVEQVFSHWAAPPAFGVALVCAGLSSTWTGIIAGQAASEGFLGRPVNAWLHRLMMRAGAAAIASLSAWTYGNEGVYQMLVLSQVLLLVQLPFTFIPLIRLTSSTSYMGKEKISSLLEVLAWLVLLFILSLDVCLVFGTLFGQSEDWDSNWEASGVGSEWSFFTVLGIISVATAAIGFLVWLVFSPIRSDAPSGSSACTEELVESPVAQEELEDSNSTLDSATQPRLFSSFKDLSMRVNAFPEPEVLPAVNQVLEMRLGEFDPKELPASNVVVVSEEVAANGDIQAPEVVPVKEVPELVSVQSPEAVAQAGPLPVESPASAPVNDNKKEEEEVEALDKLDQEAAGDDLLSSPMIVGSEGGSISRQAGLGRAARRQFSMILEEFWGLLFDYHGQPVVAGPPELSSRSVQESSINNNSSSLRHTSSRGDGLLTSSSLDGLTRSHSSLSASTSQSHNSWLFDYPGRSAYTLGGEQPFSSLRHFSYHEDVDSQPATIHGYNIASHTRAGALQNARARTSLHLDLQPRRTIGDYNPAAFFNNKSDSNSGVSHGFSSVGNAFQGTTTTTRSRDPYDCGQWSSSFTTDSVDRWNPLVYRATGELDKSLGSNAAPLPFDDISPSQSHRDGFSIQAASQHTDSLWARQPFEQLFGASSGPAGAAGVGVAAPERKPLCSLSNGVEFDASVLQHLRLCVRKLLQLEGSPWLFRFENGCDEDLIACAAAREKYLLEAPHPNPILNGCGESCAWGSELVVSFGAWCIHRVLELALVESRPELWGKYTYVLNRLQGILDPAFSPRSVLQPCLCLQGYQQNGRLGYEELLPAGCWSWGRNSSSTDGKPHGSLVYLEMIKEVENAVGSRKGRTGTAAGDIAFPKGKGNLASVLKRYKRRLRNRTGNGCGPRRSIC